MDNNLYPWAETMNCAVTVCDAKLDIIYQNAAAREVYRKHGNLIGANLLDCHNEHSREIINRLMATGGTNSYTISKNGQKKMIYQTAWRDEQGAVAGLVEISMVIPDEMPHFIRTSAGNAQ